MTDILDPAERADALSPADRLTTDLAHYDAQVAELGDELAAATAWFYGKRIAHAQIAELRALREEVEELREVLLDDPGEDFDHEDSQVIAMMVATIPALLEEAAKIKRPTKALKEALEAADAASAVFVRRMVPYLMSEAIALPEGDAAPSDDDTEIPANGDPRVTT